MGVTSSPSQKENQQKQASITKEKEKSAAKKNSNGKTKEEAPPIKKEKKKVMFVEDLSVFDDSIMSFDQSVAEQEDGPDESTYYIRQTWDISRFKGSPTENLD